MSRRWRRIGHAFRMDHTLYCMIALQWAPMVEGSEVDPGQREEDCEEREINTRMEIMWACMDHHTGQDGDAVSRPDVPAGTNKKVDRMAYLLIVC